MGGYNGIFGLISAKVNPTAEVFIFEPEPENFKHIQNNITLNGLANVTVLRMAISDKKGTVKFRDHAGGTGGNIAETDGLEDIEVACTTIDSWLEENKKTPTLIKLDIEGAEFRALQGMSKLLTMSSDLKILLEVHQMFLERFGNSEKEIWKLFQNMKYDSIWLDQNRLTTHYWVYKSNRS
ncbi:MAG: FkbM family methyltransferase [bacterium]|nr:FkbM family methyltransferase [bacterium]